MSLCGGAVSSRTVLDHYKDRGWALGKARPHDKLGQGRDGLEERTTEKMFEEESREFAPILFLRPYFFLPYLQHLLALHLSLFPPHTINNCKSLFFALGIASPAVATFLN